MKRVRREYDEVTSRLSGVEQRIQRKGQNRNILSLLDTLAASSAVKIDSMEQRQAANNDKYRETKVEVALKRVTLTDTVKYLHNIEDAQQLLSVKSLRVKTRPDDPQLLDVTFAVSSFEPL
jgi:general secretion pathway protein M